MDMDALSEIFQRKFSSSSVRDIAVKWNLGDELNKLQESLSAIRRKTFEQNSDKAAKMLREVFYDGEDILDEYGFYSLKSRQRQNHYRKLLQVSHIFHKIHALAFRVKMGYKMRRLVNRLHKIEMFGEHRKDAGFLVSDWFNLVPLPVAPPPLFPGSTAVEFSADITWDEEGVLLASGMSEILSDVCAPSRRHHHRGGSSPPSPVPYAASLLERVKLLNRDVIGRENDRDRIVEVLMERRDEGILSVLPIVGVGGIGKSTLMKLVYNDARVVKHFQLRIWVNVSPLFTVRKVFERIIQSTSASKGMTFRNYEMDELQNVVGDILREKVYLLVLDGVQNEDEGKWNKLKNFLVAGANGSKIVMTTRDESVASAIGTMPMYRVERLANDDCLSLFLKWASIEGQEIEYPNLVRIGVDIVQKCGGIPLCVILLGSSLHKSIREIEWTDVRDHSVWELQQNGNLLPVLKLSYEKLPSHLKACLAYCSIFPEGCEIEVNKLIQLWMAQGLIHTSHFEEPEDVGLEYFNKLPFRSFFQDIEENGLFFNSTCKMNDTVHDFLLSVAGSECSIVYSHTQNISEEVKHVAFSDYDVSGKELPTSLLQNHGLWTIFFPVDKVGPTSTSFVDNCISRFMRLRTLDLSDSSFEMLPTSIGELKHLKYLDLSSNSSIRTVPNSIGKLHCLLILRAVLCTQLAELPKDTEDLICLRHLYITTKQESFPDTGVGRLSSLRSLHLYSCKSLVSLSDELKHLRNLRTLTIVDCPKLTFLPSSMKYLTALEDLYSIDCDELTLFEWQDIEGLKMVRSFVIGGLPELGSKDVQCFENLQSLVIGGLPKLVVLPRWLEGSALTLRNLRVARCPNFMELPEWLKNLTALEKIEISKCPRLTSLPTGVHCLTELKELKIDNCPELSRECGGKDKPRYLI